MTPELGVYTLHDNTNIMVLVERHHDGKIPEVVVDARRKF